MINFTARFTKEEKLFFFSFKANKVMLYKSKENENYLNKNTDINKISCFKQVAGIFNLQKTFDSFYKSDLTSIVNNVKFLELEYVLVEKLLTMPRHVYHIFFSKTGVLEIKKVVHCKEGGVEVQTYVTYETKKKVLDAAEAWLNYKKDERKKHEKDLLAKVQAALVPVFQRIVRSKDFVGYDLNVEQIL